MTHPFFEKGDFCEPWFARSGGIVTIHHPDVSRCPLNTFDQHVESEGGYLIAESMQSRLAFRASECVNAMRGVTWPLSIPGHIKGLVESLENGSCSAIEGAKCLRLWFGLGPRPEDPKEEA